MNLKALIDAMRLRLDDKAQPYLWSKEELTEYINEAHAEAAERARLIYDETGPLTRVTVTAGKAEYALSPDILGIDRVLLVSRGDVLDRTTREELDCSLSRWPTIEGLPRMFFEREKYLRLVPTPAAADTLNLSLWRLPKAELCNDADCPEIPERFHRRMLDWAYHLAYLKRDSETFSPEKANYFEARFIDGFGIRPDSNVQRKQRLHRAPTVRSSW